MPRVTPPPLFDADASLLRHAARHAAAIARYAFSAATPITAYHDAYAAAGFAAHTEFCPFSPSAIRFDVFTLPPCRC